MSCPSLFPTKAQTNIKDGVSGYGYNYQFIGGGQGAFTLAQAPDRGKRSASLNEIKYPSSVFIAMDARYLVQMLGCYRVFYNATQTDEGTGKPHNRHTNSLNILFGDYHVKNVKVVNDVNPWIELEASCGKYSWSGGRNGYTN